MAQGKRFTLDSLPDELIMEIFSRVPTASVLRSKCVRKSWQSLLSNPSFVQLHVQRRTLNPCFHEEDETLVIQNRSFCDGSNAIYLLHFLQVKTNVAIQFPFRHIGSDLLILGTINGLFCLARPVFPSSVGMVLYNPVTSESKNLPTPSIVSDDLVSDRSWFCYDSITNDYKVVRIVWFKEVLNIPPRVEVYSLSANCWRAIEAEVPFEPGVGSMLRTIVNGVPFFLARHKGQQVPLLFSFDVGYEVFRQLPPLLGDCLYRPISFRGNLVAVLTHLQSGSLRSSSIAALENGVTWNKILIDVPYWVLEGSSAGILVAKQRGELVLYRHETQETRGVAFPGNPYSFSEVYNYTASLVPIR